MDLIRSYFDLNLNKTRLYRFECPSLQVLFFGWFFFCSFNFAFLTIDLSLSLFNDKRYVEFQVSIQFKFKLLNCGTCVEDIYIYVVYTFVHDFLGFFYFWKEATFYQMSCSWLRAICPRLGLPKNWIGFSKKTVGSVIYHHKWLILLIQHFASSLLGEAASCFCCGDSEELSRYISLTSIICINFCDILLVVSFLPWWEPQK